MAESLVSDYSENLSDDVDWALDWSRDDFDNSRRSNRWVDLALAKGAYKHFGMDYWLRSENGGSISESSSASSAPHKAGSRGSSHGPRVLLSSGQKDSLRAEARIVWERETGLRASAAALEVHHRVPLEYSHRMPGHPNRSSNLVGVTKSEHARLNRAWREFRHRTANPTSSEIMQFAASQDSIITNSARRYPR